MPKRSHNDNPNPQDAFDQSELIKHIADVVRHSDPPKGIAINEAEKPASCSSCIKN